MSEWQPIETAPYATEVLLVIDGKWVTYGAKWSGIGWDWDMKDFMDEDGRATHWMPLPPPPTKEEA